MISEEAVNAFIDEIVAVSKRHRLSIGHQDSQGAFVIEPYSEGNIEWLKQAEPTPNPKGE